VKAYFRFALIAVLLAGIACVSAIVTMQFAVHRAVVTVPDLQGLRIAEATSRAAALGLDLSVTERFYSTVLPTGRVLLQTPAPGAGVRRGWDLAVAESLGPRRIAIPNVLGKNERDALLLLRQKGLDLGAVAHLSDTQVPAVTVLAQDPGAAATGAEQPRVSLLVAATVPAEPVAWVMPDETGRAYASAATELTKLGLTVTNTEAVPAGTQIVLTQATAAGTVVAQQPPAGARVDAKTPIVLSVTSGGGTPAQ
jgi:beta-lactam-binding protein with PASTA domain